MAMERVRNTKRNNSIMCQRVRQMNLIPESDTWTRKEEYTAEEEHIRCTANKLVQLRSYASQEKRSKHWNELIDVVAFP